MVRCRFGFPAPLAVAYRSEFPQKRTPKVARPLVNSRGKTRSPKQLDIRPPPFAVGTMPGESHGISPGNGNIGAKPPGAMVYFGAGGVRAPDVARPKNLTPRPVARYKRSLPENVGRPMRRFPVPVPGLPGDRPNYRDMTNNRQKVKCEQTFRFEA